MSLSVQKINLDLTIIKFEEGMSPEDFAKELSGVIGRNVWKYTQEVFLCGGVTEYVFYCGMGANSQIYSVAEEGAILIDNNTKAQVSRSSILKLESEMKTSIGDNFKEYEISLSLNPVKENISEVTTNEGESDESKEEKIDKEDVNE